MSNQKLYDYSAIPDEMKALNHWVLWGEKKIPHYVTTDGAIVPAKSTDPKTWMSFDAALAAYTSQRYPVYVKGIGFVFTKHSGLVFVDLDKCFPLSDRVERFMKESGTFTELSQSCSGLHIIGKGIKAFKGSKFENVKKYPYLDTLACKGVEMYDSGRFCALTGIIRNGQKDLADITKLLTGLYEEIRRSEPTQNPKPKQKPHAQNVSLDDQKILDLVNAASNGAKFSRLWTGNLSEHANDHSAADLALCSLLAFYTQDPSQLDRLFRASGLMRDKWDRKTGQSTYGLMTIEKALEGITETYSPPAARQTKPENPPKQTKPDKQDDPRITVLSELDRELDEKSRQAFLKRLSGLGKDVKFDIDEHFYLLKEYYEAVKFSTDAKPQALITALLPALACNIGNKAYIRAHTTRHYCNIWSVIVAPSSIGRKTTALNLPLAPIDKLNIEYKKQFEIERRLYNNTDADGKQLKEEPVRRYLKIPSTTTEKLYEILQDNPNGLLVYSEIASFLAKMGKSYNGDFKADLVDFYDTPGLVEKSTMTRDTSIEKPCFSISCASTKEWLLKELDAATDTKSGFLQRFLICNSTKIDIEQLDFAFKTGGAAVEFVEKELARVYHTLRKFGTTDDPLEITLSAPAKALYEKTHRYIIQQINKDEDEALLSFFTRLFDGYFFRFCILFLLCDHANMIKDDPEDDQERYIRELDPEFLEVPETMAAQAFRLVYFYFQNVKSFLFSEIEATRESRNCEKILHFLRKTEKKEAKKSHLQRFTNIPLKDFNTALQSLVEQEILDELKTEYRGKVGYIYRLLI